MASLILKSDTGIVIESRPLGKDVRPINGYEKQKNGDYVKFVGDPRCISDKKTPLTLFKEPTFNDKDVIDITDSNFEDIDYNGVQLITNCISPYPIKICTFLAMCYNYSIKRHNKQLVLYGVNIDGILSKRMLDNHSWLAKITINTETRELMYWIYEPFNKNPDGILREFIKDNDA